MPQKTTIILSDLDSRIEQLIKNDIPYTVRILGKVAIYEFGMPTYYTLRRLAYKDKVILEQIERSNSCDSTGIITSIKFIDDYEPKKWHLEVCDQVFKIRGDR
jgi:hypothetical protein